MLLSLDSLVQTVTVSSTGHKTACEGVYDKDCIVLDNVVDISLHYAVCLDGYDDVVVQSAVFSVGEVLYAEECLRLLDTVLGEYRSTRLLVYDVVLLVGVKVLLGIHFLDYELGEARYELVRSVIEIGRLVTVTGDDKGSSCLVYKYGVDLVDDREVVTSLYHKLLVGNHVITEIVEAELIVSTVGNISVVRLLLLVSVLTVYYKAGGQTEEGIYATHFLTVSLCEIVVDGNDVYAVTGERVEVCGESFYESFTFTRLHLRNSSLVQEYTADELYSVGAFAKYSVVSLSYERECLGENIVKSLAVGKVRLQLVGVVAQFIVTHRAEGVCQRFYLIYCGDYFFDLLFAI